MTSFVAADIFSRKVGHSLTYIYLAHLDKVVGRRGLNGYVDWCSMFW